MKIGIIFHGHLRSFRDTQESFKQNILKEFENHNYEYEIFMHTWDKEEFTTKTWHRGAKKIKKTCLEEIKKHYNTENIEIENQNLKESSKIIFGRPYNAIKSVWYSFYKSFLLLEKFEKENNFKFDKIIVTRPDVQHFSKIFLDELEQPNTLWQSQVFTKKAASDVFLYGCRDLIEKALCQFYLNFDSIHNKKNLLKYQNNEYVFNDFIKDKVTVKTSQYCMPKDWRILRSWWKPDHFVGHRKWDRELAVKDIESNDNYKYFRRD